MSRRLLPVLALLAVAGLAACGDDSSGTTAKDTSGSTAAAVPSGTPSGNAAPAAATCSYPADATIPAAKKADPPPTTPTVGGDVPATIHTSLGDLKITLDAADAPCTVNSFVSLATQGYFDDTPCHRLTTPEMGIAILQCGDPSGTGQGGPGYSFKDELTGKEQYGAGTLAMANRGPDTNGSQFFIVYADSQLSPDYTVFGTIDPASLKPISDLAAKGVTQDSSGNTAPKEKVTINGLSWG